MPDCRRTTFECPTPSTYPGPSVGPPLSSRARGALCRTTGNARHWMRQFQDLGCDSQDLFLVSVECIGIKPKFLVPEHFVEAREQSGSLGAQLGRSVSLAERIEDLRHANPRVVNVALELAERLGPFYQ